MSRASFSELCQPLGYGKFFVSSGHRPQAPLEIQLADFLRRCGDKTSNILETARKCGVESGTTLLHLGRVAETLISLPTSYVRWPSSERSKREIRESFAKQGFDGAIGALDGAFIRLREAPSNNRKRYSIVPWKKWYGINVQATCDHEGDFTSYDVGWPVKQRYTKVFEKPRIWKGDVTLNKGVSTYGQWYVKC